MIGGTIGRAMFAATLPCCDCRLAVAKPMLPRTMARSATSTKPSPLKSPLAQSGRKLAAHGLPHDGQIARIDEAVKIGVAIFGVQNVVDQEIKVALVDLSVVVEITACSPWQ